jgi:hypothetical protein
VFKLVKFELTRKGKTASCLCENTDIDVLALENFVVRDEFNGVLRLGGEGFVVLKIRHMARPTEVQSVLLVVLLFLQTVAERHLFMERVD